MNAALFEQFQGPVDVQQVPDPRPPADGVVISVQANGICRSDWHAWMGHDAGVRLPHVPGHELAGIVTEIGPEVRTWKTGDRVTVPFAVGCGHCPQCVAGNAHICDDQFQPGFTAWGSFAEHVAIPRADFNLVRLPDAMDFVESASLGCRFVTAHRAVVTQARLAADEWMAVHGCGGVGLSAIMIGHALGARIVAIDISEAALNLAQSLGADHILNARQEPKIVEAITDLTQGGAHVSVDALGSPVTCRQSIQCLRKRGRHVQVGLMLAENANASVPMDAVIARELEIYGSHGMPAQSYAPLLAMISNGHLQPKDLVKKTVSLAEGAQHLMNMDSFCESGIVVIDRF